MKKLLTSMLTLALILCCFTFVGCFGELKPYMEVKGLKTEYNIGEALDVSNAVIHYYRDMDSERYSEVQLTKDMVSGFSTLQAGNFKMTIKYQDATLEIGYFIVILKFPACNVENPETISFVN